ncbi:hypothetical protein CHLRE_03g186700v5 [Chlamydomonas reinhardtii]|uniref:Prolyl 4-hydroxylase alpha subunit Fe(2+) 2OG dioxygenase domain-containing protein n=1 Tax=Chlamydomonas reinhardtii TaxID=3055 RepID=A0A2K3DY18_CHLRE|nr:uncharacterized protein CHLRE_03g186700v5 [Chlamydomonas reinhardtii]PNW85444.1 hypothetical protein CHLRE_03g186700v5 [Chlamydomonas reinhardtii]
MRWTVLSQVVTGAVGGPLPEVAVRGVGKLALPIDAGQAKDLIYAGQPAPYGKGTNTVLDPNVRKATQIEADRVCFSEGWDATLRRLVTGVATALSLPGGGAGVEARLYKLLVYEAGGHFKSHRDTEKEPGMFGTLLVQLPVEGGHTGGQLSIRHLGRKESWDTAAPPAAETKAKGGRKSAGGKASGSQSGSAGKQAPALQYAAFYADCEHELHTVESGLRVVLAYNLVRVQKPAAAKPAKGAAAAAAAQPTMARPAISAASLKAVTEAVRAWEAAAAAAQPLVTLPLAHKYTEANLDFGALKSDDGVKVQALLQCPLLDVHLVLISKTVIGTSYNSGACYHKRRRRHFCWGYDDESDSEGYEDSEDMAETAVMDEIYDTDTATGAWISPLFGRLHQGASFYLPLEDSMLDDDEVFPDGLEPDDREYEGYTGNEGPTLTHVYHRAVVVAWLRSRRSQLLAKPGSLSDAIALAEQRLAQLRGSGSGGRDDTRAVGAARTKAQPYPAASLQQYLLQLEERQPHPVDDSRKQADAKQALQAVLDCAAKEVPVWMGGRPTVHKALTLFTSPGVAQLCGQQWQQQACVRVVQSLTAPATVWDLTQEGLPAAIASAATALSSTAFNDAVADLVARQAPRQPRDCYRLVAHEALPAALRVRMVQAFRTAVFGNEAAAAGNGTAAAVAGGSGCLAQMQATDVCFLAGLVFSTEGAAAAGAGAAAAPCSGMAGAFTAAVLRRGDCQALLQALLKEAAVRQALSTQPPEPAAVELVVARARYLEPRVQQGVPKLDFSMPNASCDDARVTEFLRSPNQSQKFGGFGSIVAARRWANAYQCAGGCRMHAAAAGSGRNAFVQLTKGRDIYNQQLAQYQAAVKELAEVRALVGAAPAAPAAGLAPAAVPGPNAGAGAAAGRVGGAAGSAQGVVVPRQQQANAAVKRPSDVAAVGAAAQQQRLHQAQQVPQARTAVVLDLTDD